MTYFRDWEVAAFCSHGAQAEVDQACFRTGLIELFVAICFGFFCRAVKILVCSLIFPLCDLTKAMEIMAFV